MPLNSAQCIADTATIRGAMQITVNGIHHDTPPKTTISELLKQLNISAERIAIEINLTVIDRADYHVSVLHEGDQIEIISFIGGGKHAD